MYSLTEIEDLTSATDAYAEMNAGQEASRLHRLVIPYPPKPFLNSLLPNQLVKERGTRWKCLGRGVIARPWTQVFVMSCHCERKDDQDELVGRPTFVCLHRGRRLTVPAAADLYPSKRSKHSDCASTRIQNSPSRTLSHLHSTFATPRTISHLHGTFSHPLAPSRAFSWQKKL
ncbi:hypothetical protein M405DRAFT_879720 [Rhizopogon salebrosus TDB-379]|nr:hypothetical protein M405DRAFT_879720 [Rhizopogon salebrosus TDB-379]